MSVGLIPQARHGASGVWALAEVGSKFEGTGLEKLHMVHTQVADTTFEGAGAGREEDSVPKEDGPLRCGLFALDVP